MDNFENIFWLIIIIIWAVTGFLRAKKSLPKKELPRQKPAPLEPEELEQEIPDLFGFPFPKKTYEVPQPKFEPEPVSKVKKEIELEPLPTPAPSPKITLAEKEPSLAFTPDKLQEGIILSEVLGPPKAYQFWQGRKR